MSDVAVIDQAAAKPHRVRRITPVMKRALNLMVWDGKTDNDAAVQLGITVTHIRLSLREPHVRGYYRRQLEVLRERESSRNIHALIEVRDQKGNQMARVQAVKAIEQLADEQQSGASKASLPGLVVQINVGSHTSIPQPMREVHDASSSHNPSD